MPPSGYSPTKVPGPPAWMTTPETIDPYEMIGQFQGMQGNKLKLDQAQREATAAQALAEAGAQMQLEGGPAMGSISDIYQNIIIPNALKSGNLGTANSMLGGYGSEQRRGEMTDTANIGKLLQYGDEYPEFQIDPDKSVKDNIFDMLMGPRKQPQKEAKPYKVKVVDMGKGEMPRKVYSEEDEIQAQIDKLTLKAQKEREEAKQKASGESDIFKELGLTTVDDLQKNKPTQAPSGTATVDKKQSLLDKRKRLIEALNSRGVQY